MSTRKPKPPESPPPVPAARPDAATLAARLARLEGELAPVLAAIAIEDREENPPNAVATVILQGRRLVEPARAHRAALLDADTDAVFVDQLEARLDLLEASESRWAALRDAGPDTALPEKRAAADKVRTDMMRHARRHLRRAPAALSRLDAIDELQGDADADRYDDLTKLADLYDEHPDRLPAKKQPRDIAAQARAAARALAATVEHTKARVDPTTARLTRNAAYLLAIEAISEVSDGGAFAFENDDPVQAARFRVTLRRRTSAKPKAPAPPPAPEPPKPPAPDR